MANETQISDYRWFIENLSSLYNKYGDVFLAIKNHTVIGTFKSFADGVRTVSKNEPAGSFIIQQCAANAESFTGHIASMNFLS